MQGEKIFLDYFFSPLKKEGVAEMTLRDYKHEQDRSVDDPSGTLTFRHVPLREVDATIDELFKCHDEGEDRGIAITSCVRTEIGLRRLLLIDFAIGVTLKNEHALYRALRASAMFPGYKNGALMRTTNSYHFIGFTPLRYNAWVRAMGHGLLLGGRDQPLVDMRYIGHSLHRGYGALRVSDMGTKETPTLVTLL